MTLALTVHNLIRVSVKIQMLSGIQIEEEISLYLILNLVFLTIIDNSYGKTRTPGSTPIQI